MQNVWTESDSVRALSVQGLPPAYTARLEARKAVILTAEFALPVGNHRVQTRNEIRFCSYCGEEVFRIVLFPTPQAYFSGPCICAKCQKQKGFGYIHVLPPRSIADNQEVPFEYLVAEFLLNAEAFI